MTVMTEEQRQKCHTSMLMSCTQQLCKRDNVVSKRNVTPYLVAFMVN